jgi:hypothetical protein
LWKIRLSSPFFGGVVVQSVGLHTVVDFEAAAEVLSQLEHAPWTIVVPLGEQVQLQGPGLAELTGAAGLAGALADEGSTRPPACGTGCSRGAAGDSCDVFWICGA